MKNIHILPTDKPSRLHEYDYLSPMGLSKEPLQWRLGRNIYITSDEKIKNEDWCITAKGNLLQMIEEDTVLGFALLGCKKIILTTDQDLIKNGVQPIDDEFLEWFMNNSSCESFEVVEQELNTDYRSDWKQKFYYKIIIPKKKLEGIPKGTINMVIGKPKQETLEEFIKEVLNEEFFTNISEYRKAERLIELVAKWQLEQDKNKYSEEEVILLLQKSITHQDDGETGSLVTAQGKIRTANFYSWFERFKKQ